MYGTIRDQLSNINRRSRVSNTKVISKNTKEIAEIKKSPKLQENPNRSTSLADFDNKGNNLFSSPIANSDLEIKKTKGQI